MPELERRLRELGAEVAYPPTPDLAGSVGERLRTHATPRAHAVEARPRTRPAPVAGAPALPRPRPGPVRWRSSALWRRTVLAVAASALVLGLSAAAFPHARNSVLEWLGVQGVVVKRVPDSPRAPARSGVADLGERVSLAQAQARTPYRIVVPQALGRPDAVYLRPDPYGGELSFVYAPRPGIPRSRLTGVGLLLGQFRGGDVQALLHKQIGTGTRAEPVSVDGQPGVWLTGKPHAFFYRDPAGEPVPRTLRLATDTLLWSHGELTLRLEGELSKARALAIAASTR